MKYISFFTEKILLLLCIGITVMSCEESPELRYSSEDVILDACPTNIVSIDIAANVHWTVNINQSEDWLTVKPMEGKGNATLVFTAIDNSSFSDRVAHIAISGDGMRTDSIKVIQFTSVDVVEKIEDEAFKQYCIAKYDNSPKDGQISQKEAKNTEEGADEINVKGMKIRSLAGIEYFTEITYLECSNNSIENLDVSKNGKLKVLNCKSNYIESLDLSNNKELISLDCSYNPVEYFNVDGLDKLRDLYIYSTEIGSINLSSNTSLKWLGISNNKLVSIDVSNNIKLEGLECNENGFTNLDVSKNAELVTLYCGNNKLTTLDLSMNTKLMNLWCDNNRFVGGTIDVSRNAELKELSCTNNRFTSLSLKNNINLEQLYCDANDLKALDISNNTKLTSLKCSSNKLEGSIDISNNKNLKILDLRNNPNLTAVLHWSELIINTAAFFIDSPPTHYEPK